MSIVVTFEPLGALYVQLRDARVTRTVELVKDELLVDLDEHANVLGIEALRPGRLDVFLRELPDTYHLPEEARFIDFKQLDRAFVMAGV
jgi:hypothetical protein